MLKESNWWTERYDTLKNDKSKLEKVIYIKLEYRFVDITYGGKSFKEYWRFTINLWKKVIIVKWKKFLTTWLN